MTIQRKTDIPLLMALAEHRVLTARQLGAIVGRNVRSVGRRLRELVESGLLQRRPLQQPRRAGRPEQVYGLVEPAIVYLKEHIDIAAPDPGRLLPSPAKVPHQVLVNEFRVCMMQATRQLPKLQSRFLSPDSLLAPPGEDGKPFIHDLVAVSKAKASGLIPDGVFALTHTDRDKPLLFFLEVDRNTEDLTTIRTKLVRYQAYFRSEGYRRYEGHWQLRFNGFRVLLVCQSGNCLLRLCDTVAAMPPSDFVWVSAMTDIESIGWAGPCWARGGNLDAARQSILGGRSQGA